MIRTEKGSIVGWSGGDDDDDDDGGDECGDETDGGDEGGDETDGGDEGGDETDYDVWFCWGCCSFFVGSWSVPVSHPPRKRSNDSLCQV